MKFYATFDANGTVTGAWSDHDDEIPTSAEEVTAEDFGLIQSIGPGAVSRVNGVVAKDADREAAQRLAMVEHRKLLEIKQACDNALAVLSAEYPETEVTSWSQQIKEAEALQADPAAPAPLLDGIAAARGMTTADLATKVMEKATQFTAASGPLFGKRQAIEDKIKTIKSDAQKSDDQKAAAIEALSW
jgi:hypothetical protein